MVCAQVAMGCCSGARVLYCLVPTLSPGARSVYFVFTFTKKCSAHKCIVESMSKRDMRERERSGERDSERERQRERLKERPKEREREGER